SAIEVRVDHTVETEVEALFERVSKESGRLDVLVNSIAGEDRAMGGWSSFWTTDLTHAETALRQSLLSHIITAKHAAAGMIQKRRGLIVEVTERCTERRRQPRQPNGQTSPQGAGPQHGGGIAPARRIGSLDHAGFSPLGGHARGVRRHRGDLARRR